MEEKKRSGSPAPDEKVINIKSLVFEYLIHWPFILLFLAACLCGAWLYLRYQEPVYRVSSTVLIKQGDRTKMSSSQSLANMQDLGMLSMASNFDNEIEILQSRTLIEKVVRSLDLYISYKDDVEFGYDHDLYGVSPVKVWMSPDEAAKLCAPLRVGVSCRADGKMEAEASYVAGGKEQSRKKTFARLPAVFITPVGTLSLSYAPDSVAPRPSPGFRMTATVVSPVAAAGACKARLAAAPTGEFTSIVRLDYNDGSVRRGEDFLNRLVELYNRDANDDKNQVATRTAQFIDERIAIINQELGDTENELATYKQQAGLTDLSADAQLALQGSSEYEKRRAENENQIRLAGFLREYIDNPSNQYEVIPSNVGLEDNQLGNIIAQYNEMLIERKRLLRSSDESNPAVVNLDISINATRNAVRTTVESVEAGLQITRHNLELEARKYQSRVSSAPQQERRLIGITRQQSIKADLYLMLLQKREENAITLAATANNGRMVESPAPAGQVSPNRNNIYMIAFILGLVFPVGGIWAFRQLRFKIEGRPDVERITDAPVVGDVPQIKKGGEEGIVVRENQNGLNEEIFRSVRTNVQYMLEEDEKVILFTSTISGEGKSFVASNLAASFAFMDKKTVVVGLDIRRPGLNRVFGLDRKAEGLTAYLSAPRQTDLLSLCHPSGVSPNLYVLPGGVVPPNPTELVARQALDDAIGILKAHFDYVILDTAPIGVVTDTHLVARVADICVYVCRADYTRKSEYELINDLKREKKFPRVCTLINGLDMNKRHNGYYYGYGKYGKYGKYGHGKKYGYGYGYGYGKEKK